MTAKVISNHNSILDVPKMSISPPGDLLKKGYLGEPFLKKAYLGEQFLKKGYQGEQFSKKSL